MRRPGRRGGGTHTGGRWAGEGEAPEGSAGSQGRGRRTQAGGGWARAATVEDDGGQKDARALRGTRSSSRKVPLPDLVACGASSMSSCRPHATTECLVLSIRRRDVASGPSQDNLRPRRAVPRSRLTRGGAVGREHNETQESCKCRVWDTERSGHEGGRGKRGGRTGSKYRLCRNTAMQLSVEGGLSVHALDAEKTERNCTHGHEPRRYPRRA